MAGDREKIAATHDRLGMVNCVARAQCQLSSRFGVELFSLPALNILFELYRSNSSQPRSLSSICASSKAPERTALRLINRLVEREFILRIPDARDQRRVNVAMSPHGRTQLDAYLDALLDLMADSKSSKNPL